MEHATLHDRLHAIGKRLDAAEETLREKAHLGEHAHQIAKELKDRYAHLQGRLNGETAEAHSEQVSDLERSVQQWLESYDTAHVSSK